MLPLRPILLPLVVLVCLTPAGAADRDEAGALLAEAGGRGGFVVHLGGGDPGAPGLTAALHAAGAAVVQGLDADPAAVAKARAHIQSQGIYGSVSAAHFDGTHLPYADNLVNLLVAKDLGRVPREEAVRVLAPGGVLCVRSGDGWKRTVKPRPGNTDEWTHYLHDASGNAVAHDAVVGPPRRVQWIAPPRHTRGHEHIPSINALVSAKGRLFYLADEGPIAFLRQPARWHLVARDAYNGLALWKRAFDPWFPHIINWGKTPPDLQRRLVAHGDRLFVTLGLHAPLSVLDAATGETLKTVDGTAGTEEILYHEGILLLARREVTEDRKAELERWHRLERQPDSPVFERESAEPFVNRLRKTRAGADPSILALDADTGRVLWTKPKKDVGGLRPLTLCALGDRVYFQNSKGTRCVDLKTGRERWTRPAGPLLVVCGNTVICGGTTLVALSAETGEVRWKQDGLLVQVRDAFVAGGSLWIGGFKPWPRPGKKHGGPPWGPYYAVQRDLATGKVLRQVEPENPGHHHRCWRNKATDRYILGGRRGVEFIDLATGDVRWHNWVRGVCRYGVMPANGLLYAPPHACGCYITAKLDGFFALAPAAEGAATAAARVEAPDGRLQKGPAYARIENRASKIGNGRDWPTFRHDAARTGCTDSAIPTDLRPAWTASVGGAVSPLTVGGGRVCVAAIDAHRLCALDAETGKPVWDVTAGGRVDSPPTLDGGRAIFGSSDGCVTSVRLADGALAWRLRVARRVRCLVVRGQLESAWPVPGSVLVRDGTIYATAGRSSYLDGGIDLCRIESATGKMLSRTPIYSPDPQTGRQPDQYGPNAMPGALADILVADAEHVYLRDTVFDTRGRPQPQENSEPHLLTLTGFRNAAWPHRSYWIVGTHTSLSTGCSGQERGLMYGRLLVPDGDTVYGYGRAKVDWSNMLQDGPYRVFARQRAERKERWTQKVPIRVRALVRAGKVLFAAGPVEGGADAGGNGQEALLVALSAADGKELGRVTLEAPPVLDGLAAAAGRLYLAATDGTVVCLEGGKRQAFAR